MEELTLTNNQSVEYTTNATTAGANPVLHLLRKSGTSWVQVAVNDNYIALESRILFQNTTGSTQSYLLVLRNASLSFGTTTLRRNGAKWEDAAPVGGQLVSASSLGFGASDEVLTRHRPGGSLAHALLTLTTADSLTIGKVAYMNGAAGAAVIPSIGTGIFKFLVGTPWLKSSIGYDNPRSGPVDLFGNDVGTDSDGDGVGNAVETLLGTCTSGTCQYSYLPNDSDRDGLTDGEERWGITGTDPDGRDDIAFGRWGADPTRKDAFVEVDYAFDFGSPVPNGTNPFDHMRSPGWNVSPPLTTTVEAWVDAVRAPFLVAPASHIKNLGATPPDGVQIHLDIGVAPIDEMDEAKFGDFPSATRRCLVKDWIIEFLNPSPAQIVVRIQDPQGGPDHISNAIALSNMSPTSAALVTAVNIPTGYAESWMIDLPPLGTGYNNVAARLRIRTQRPCVNFIGVLTDDGSDAAFATNVTQKRETFEALKFRNRGPYSQEFDAVRRTRFRYVALSGGGQANQDRFSVRMDADTFVHELGHTFGLEHWGRFDWNISPGSQSGPTCLPHYRSVMDYVHDPSTPRFSLEDGLTFNPANVNEAQPFGPNGVGLGFNQPGPWQTNIDPWNYFASFAAIDFDRSGSSIPSSGLRRSWGLSAHNKNCDAFREGETRISTASALNSTDLVRIGTRLFAFWMDSANVYWASAPLGGAGNKSCTGSANPRSGAPCLTWSAPQPLTTGAYSGLSAAQFGGQIFVALTLADNRLSVRRFNITAPSFNPIEVIPAFDLSETSDLSRRSTLAPELTFLHDANRTGDLAILYRSEDTNRYYMRVWQPASQTWALPTQLVDGASNPITGHRAPGALAWPGEDATGFSAAQRRTLAVLPVPACRLYMLDPTGTGKWLRIVNSDFDGLPCDRQPSMALRTQRTSAGTVGPSAPGHIMLTYSSGFGPSAAPRVAFTRLVSREAPPALGAGFALLKSNAYWISSGTAFNSGANLALYSDVTLDNVFGLAAMTRGDDGDGAFFYPHGDGAPDFTFGVNSDFRVMEDETCRFLRFSAPTFDATAWCKSYAFD